MAFRSYGVLQDSAYKERTLPIVSDQRFLYSNRFGFPVNCIDHNTLVSSYIPSSVESMSVAPSQPVYPSAYYVVALPSNEKYYSQLEDNFASEKGAHYISRQLKEPRDVNECHSTRTYSTGCCSPTGSVESAADSLGSPSAGSNVPRPSQLTVIPPLVPYYEPHKRTIYTANNIHYTLPYRGSATSDNVRSSKLLRRGQLHPRSKFEAYPKKHFTTSPTFCGATNSDLPYNGIVGEITEQPLNLTVSRKKIPTPVKEPLNDMPKTIHPSISNSNDISHIIDNNKRRRHFVDGFMDTGSAKYRDLSLSHVPSNVPAESDNTINSSNNGHDIESNTNESFTRNNTAKPQTVSPLHTNLRSAEAALLNTKTELDQSGVQQKKVKAVKISPKTDITTSQCLSSSVTRRKDPLLKTPRKKPRLHQCPHCPKAFPLPWKLKVHNRVHSGEKPYQCHVCGKRFSVRCNLRDHIQLHTGNRPWKCNQCTSEFSWPSQLKAHKRVHSGERPYKCQYCSMSFAWSSSKSHHERVHRGEKHYQCQSCDKKFQRKSALKNHSRIHTGLKPYCCRFCDKEFSHKTSMTQHERQHTGEKPYSCTICDERFLALRAFRKHKTLVHNPVYPHVCCICLINFQTVSDLQEHNHILHSTEPSKERNKPQIELKETSSNIVSNEHDKMKCEDSNQDNVEEDDDKTPDVKDANGFTTEKEVKKPTLTDHTSNTGNQSTLHDTMSLQPSDVATYPDIDKKSGKLTPPVVNCPFTDDKNRSVRKSTTRLSKSEYKTPSLVKRHTPSNRLHITAGQMVSKQLTQTNKNYSCSTPDGECHCCSPEPKRKNQMLNITHDQHYDESYHAQAIITTSDVDETNPNKHLKLTKDSLLKKLLQQPLTNMTTAQLPVVKNYLRLEKACLSESKNNADQSQQIIYLPQIINADKSATSNRKNAISPSKRQDLMRYVNNVGTNGTCVNTSSFRRTFSSELSATVSVA